LDGSPLRAPNSLVLSLLSSVSARHRQGGKALHVLCEDSQQDLRDERVGPEAEGGVDSRCVGVYEGEKESETTF